jgi:GNAT superfamily N-acetyltransferase
MEIIIGGIESIDKIEPLWLQLNLHHSSISPFFKDDFKKFKFEDRKKTLIEKANKGNLKIFMFCTDNIPQGYCIASIEENEGEIDSIYINEKYRKMGIGSQLMSSAINWLKENGIVRIKVGVVFGNENAFSFYQKFGLFPRVTYLMTEYWHSGNNQQT